MDREELNKRKAMLEIRREDAMKRDSDDWRTDEWWGKAKAHQKEHWSQFYPKYGQDMFEDYFNHLRSGRVKNIKEFALINGLEKHEEKYKILKVDDGKDNKGTDKDIS